MFWVFFEIMNWLTLNSYTEKEDVKFVIRRIVIAAIPPFLLIVFAKYSIAAIKAVVSVRGVVFMI
jgi:hypothetical protein